MQHRWDFPFFVEQHNTGAWAFAAGGLKAGVLWSPALLAEEQT
jgi:hypothetical protein